MSSRCQTFTFNVFMLHLVIHLMLVCKAVSVCIDVLQVICRVGHQFKWGRDSALHAEGHCAVLLCPRQPKEPHLCGQHVQLTQGEA